MALKHRPVFGDKKVIICVSFVVYSRQNPVVNRTATISVVMLASTRHSSAAVHCTEHFLD